MDTHWPQAGVKCLNIFAHFALRQTSSMFFFLFSFLHWVLNDLERNILVFFTDLKKNYKFIEPSFMLYFKSLPMVDPSLLRNDKCLYIALLLDHSECFSSTSHARQGSRKLSAFPKDTSICILCNTLAHFPFWWSLSFFIFLALTSHCMDFCHSNSLTEYLWTYFHIVLAVCFMWLCYYVDLS